MGWTWQTIGAAAAAGKLLGLNSVQMANALGQAFMSCPIYIDIPKQNRPFYEDGTPANSHRYQLSGACTEAGINAALLAADGWVAQRDVFDEGSEFWKSFSALGCDWDLMYGGLGDRWFIEETSIKPYPFCRFAHSSLDQFIGMVRDLGLDADAIDSVVVRTPPFRQLEEIITNRMVDEPLKLFVSLPTAMALIAEGVTPGPRWWKEDLQSERIRKFTDKVECEVVPELAPVMAQQLNESGYFLRIPTEVVIVVDGVEHRRSGEHAFGDAFAPGFAMADTDVADKARAFLEDQLPQDRIEALIANALKLDAAESLDDFVSTWVGSAGH
jgi:2-methylcitrate dehydratase PrpD